MANGYRGRGQGNRSTGRWSTTSVPMINRFHWRDVLVSQHVRMEVDCEVTAKL